MPPNVLMVFPRFGANSSCSLRALCAVWGVRCPTPPLGLIAVAALLPSTWNIRLVTGTPRNYVRRILTGQTWS